jgi:hypothetical protein
MKREITPFQLFYFQCVTHKSKRVRNSLKTGDIKMPIFTLMRTLSLEVF